MKLVNVHALLKRKFFLKSKFEIRQRGIYVKSFTTCARNGSAVDLSFTVYAPEQLKSAVPVVILHGLLGSKLNWRSLGKTIAVTSKRQVFTLDARNHGDSPHSEEGNVQIMAQDVKHFLNSRNIPEAIVIGHSMGGRTAMALALAENNLVHKLAVVDISPHAMPGFISLASLNYMSAMEEALKTVTPNTRLIQARKIVDQYLARTVPEIGIRQFLLTNLTEKDDILTWKPNLKVLKTKFPFSITEFPTALGTFTGETLVITGGNSPYVRIEDHQSIRELFPKAEFVVIPGAGHWVHSEKPSEFMQVLSKFL